MASATVPLSETEIKHVKACIRAHNMFHAEIKALAQSRCFVRRYVITCVGDEVIILEDWMLKNLKPIPTGDPKEDKRQAANFSHFKCRVCVCGATCVFAG